MKKFIFGFIGLIGLAFVLSGSVFAQGANSFSTSSQNNIVIQNQRQEEQEGKKLLDELNNKTVACSRLKDADFEKIGEYFMGQTIGDTSRHVIMNEMMKEMMGKQGEEQAHIVMGKRLSGCEPNASMSRNMMGMIGGGLTGGSGDYMMGSFGANPVSWSFGAFGWIFMIIWWLLIIVGIVALSRWLMSQSRGRRGYDHKNYSLEILKERYVKGEINKEEFEEKKKDLSS